MSYFDRIDTRRMVGVITHENDDGEEIETEIPLKYEVCSRCQGKGTHCNPSIDGNGLTAEDFAEDPDFEEAYFGGAYDVTCEECNGARVSPVVSDDAKLSDEQQAALDFADRAAYYDDCDRRTQRMESGGW